MFAVIFICGNLFLRIAGKTAEIAKIGIRKNFVPHGGNLRSKTLSAKLLARQKGVIHFITLSFIN